jgi:hypothetical protein
MRRPLALLAIAGLSSPALAAEPQTQPNPDAGAAYARELAADASSRVSLSDDAPSFGHDSRGFFFGDGAANKLWLGGNAQFRYNANWRDNTTSPDSGFANGFQYRRLRLVASGTVINSNLSFKVEGEAASGDSLQLLETWGEYKLNSATALKWGQFKIPLLREELVSHTAQLTADRSVTNAVFTQNYSQGVQLSYASGDIKLAGALSDGLNTLNTDFAAATSEADYALTGRVDFKWAGDWKQNDQFTSFRGSAYAGFLGAAVHYQNGGATATPSAPTPTSTTDRGVCEYTADVSVKADGWNFFAAFIGRNTEDRPSDSSFNDFGLVIQGGLFVCNEAELFLRYDEVFPDSDRGATSDDFATITTGVNWYMVPQSHAAKLTTDVCWFLDDQAGSASLVRPNTGLGLLPSTEDNQIALRVQFQMLF